MRTKPEQREHWLREYNPSRSVAEARAVLLSADLEAAERELAQMREELAASLATRRAHVEALTHMRERAEVGEEALNLVCHGEQAVKQALVAARARIASRKEQKA